MPRRRVWSALSQAYRARLQRSGVTQTQYESGVSLKAARGHSKTPESPKEYVRHPERFKKYKNKRQPLVDVIVEKKRRIFGDRFKYDEGRSVIYVKEGKADVLPPTTKKLKFLAGLTDDEFDDFQYEHRFEDDWNFLWYR